MNSAVIAAVLPAAACRRSEVLRLEVPRPVAWLAAAHIRDACMRWGVYVVALCGWMRGCTCADRGSVDASSALEGMMWSLIR